MRGASRKVGLTAAAGRMTVPERIAFAPFPIAMFDTLNGRLNSVFRKLRSRGKLHPKQVDGALTEIRTALLDADVALDVADEFLGRVRARRPSADVMGPLTPSPPGITVRRG